MSVLKSKRKQSDFEVFHHLNKMRQEITDLLLRDFGYDSRKATQRIERQFGGRNYCELTELERERYNRLVERNKSFDLWFIKSERDTCVNCLRDINQEIYVANSIYPMYKEELIERRLHQDRAIGLCYRLTQELQYAIETLPIDINKYLRFGEMIQREIDLIKGWRKSDNRFKRVISDNAAANFANVNNNGNANYNNASNANGVRPDFDTVRGIPFE